MSQTGDPHSTRQIFPLSYGQRALWFLQQLAPQSVAYNGMLAVRIYSDVDVAALRRAFQALTDRHRSLRTTYTVHNGQPVQQVHEHLPVYFEPVDAGTWSETELNNRLRQETHRPFDLERGPVLRVHVFTRSGADHILLLTVHHIALDFLSLGMLMDELRVLYPAENAGAPVSLPALDLQYTDYVRWQAEMLAGPEGRRLWAHWQKQLTGELPALNLPTDRPRPPVQTFGGAVHPFKLDEELTHQLKALAKEEGATLLATVLAAFQVLLYCYSGQEDIVIGSPATGRTQPEFDKIVGYFVNPVVLRAKLSGNLTFRTFLDQVHHTVQSALAHQDYPFPFLVERLQPARDPSRSPLFQAMFVLYRPEEQGVLPLLMGDTGVRVDLGGLEVAFFPLEQRGAMLDLTLIMVEGGGSLAATLQYNTDLFDAATIARMIDRFQTLLNSMVTTPDQRLSTISLAGPAEPHQLLAEWNDDQPATEGIEFSLFYFATDDTGDAGDRYRLLIEGAQFADHHGLAAVWTPERHFHPFGGLYPNPSVTSAAIATITTRIQIRAGSVVLPLHNPIRVAEEWSVVDNLSKGRVAVSFASGWNVNDFVFAPEKYADRKEIMVREIETVRRLWRGEAVSVPGAGGKMVEVQIHPPPIQRELPIWITAVGNPGTFRMAGEMGANLLTHLVGQNMDELAEKIALYRAAWREHHHGPGAGHVSVMLHTFIGEDIDDVREKVRKPFCDYLKSSFGLIEGLARSLGADLDARPLTEATREIFLSHAFERYFGTTSLFGTPDTCLQLIDRLRAIGVDEIACLIDFGVDVDSVMSSLPYLSMVKERSNEHRRSAAWGTTITVQPGMPDERALAEYLSQEQSHQISYQQIHDRAHTRQTLMKRQQQFRRQHQAPRT
jgi:natural product biosynthesis luciferase-like monooxygenase protein